MAVYSKLLLSAGGGIISTQQQAEQAQNTASVLIGLGGTGIDCLRTIKTQVRARLKPDDPDAVIASYSHIRFLGIDTAERSRGAHGAENEKADALVSLNDTEFFSIANANIKKAFTNPLALKQRRELSWLRWEDIDAPDLSKAGAGGIKQIGRYMMMDKSQVFLSRIEREINAAKSGLSEPAVNIHIFSGLSGGTGAGCFLDVCYMVRSIAEKVGGVTIFGYFFLPDVNLDRIPFTDTKTRAYIPKNGYASMQELDYCMQLQYNGGSFVQEYQGHKRIDWKTGPVDMCHLICATNSAGDVIPNAYQYAMSVTAEYLMDFLTFSDKAFNLTEQLSNFRQKVRTADGEKMIGSNLAYCVIGASCASIPLREINTYLASELFSKFSVTSGNVPSKEDVETLAASALAKDARNTSEIYLSLLREIRNRAGDDYSPYIDDWKFVRDYGNAEILSHYASQTEAKLNAVVANAMSMAAASNELSLVSRIKVQLADAIKDLNRGPIFVYRTLSAAENHNLLSMIDGFLAENNTRWKKEASQANPRMRDYNEAKFNFDSPKGLIKKYQKNFRDYEYCLMLLEQHKLALQIYEKLDKVLKEFRKQIVEVTASYYIKLNRVTETLMNTFRENRDALASEKMMVSSSFSIPMMTIKEMKTPLDEEIEKINAPGMFDTFMGLLMDNESEWMIEDENKISRLVTGFFARTAFEGFANRTITAFLKDKYGIDNDEQLADRVYEDWMKLLTAKASPLFYFNGSVWRESQTSKLAFLSIPATSAPIKAAARKMYETDTLWEIKESALTDRIYVMCSACALPLSAYSNCEEYEKVSFSTTDPGRYCYEGKEIPGIDFNDWRKLPSLTPQSMIQMEKAPYAMRDLVEAGYALYEEAIAYNILGEQNRICRPDETAVENLKTLITECEATTEKLSKPDETAGAAKLLNQLKEAMEIPMLKTGMAMQNDGYAEKVEDKKKVQKDHFISSPAYHEVVKQMIAKISGLAASAHMTAADLEEKITGINEGGRELGHYFDALFYGVISFDGKVIIYHKAIYDISSDKESPPHLRSAESIVLSKRGNKFPFGNIPVYQAFINYRGLKQEEKDEITRLVDERYNADAPEIRDTGLKLKAEISDDRVNAWMQLAANYEQRAEILEFLSKIKQQFHIFCVDNSI